MIVRMWHGRTSRDKGDDYQRFVEARAIPDYRSTPGNRFAAVFRRDDGEVTHFVTFTIWDSFDAIRAFAGADIAIAKYYKEDRDFLLEFEPTVVHYELTAFDGSV